MTISGHVSGKNDQEMAMTDGRHIHLYTLALTWDLPTPGGGAMPVDEATFRAAKVGDKVTLTVQTE